MSLPVCSRKATHLGCGRNDPNFCFALQRELLVVFAEAKVPARPIEDGPVPSRRCRERIGGAKDARDDEVRLGRQIERPHLHDGA